MSNHTYIATQQSRNWAKKAKQFVIEPFFFVSEDRQCPRANRTNQPLCAELE
jgi:hypothetical protein